MQAWAWDETDILLSRDVRALLAYRQAFHVSQLLVLFPAELVSKAASGLQSFKLKKGSKVGVFGEFHLLG